MASTSLLLGLGLALFAVAPAAPVEGRLRHTRVETFVLEHANATADDEPVGLLVLRRQACGDETRLSLELVMGQGQQELRLTHQERLEPERTTLIWREVAATSAALVMAQGEPMGALDVHEWDGDGRRRGTESSRGLLVTPLHLAELVRVGEVREGSYHLFDPLTRRVEWLRITTRPHLLVGGPPARGEPREAAGDLAPPSPVRRTVEWKRADGRLRSRLTFGPSGLERWVLQEGGLVARRVDPDAFGVLANQLGVRGLVGPRIELGERGETGDEGRDEALGWSSGRSDDPGRALRSPAGHE